jgi:hypothetical protein
MRILVVLVCFLLLALGQRVARGAEDETDILAAPPPDVLLKLLEARGFAEAGRFLHDARKLPEPAAAFTKALDSGKRLSDDLVGELLDITASIPHAEERLLFFPANLYFGVREEHSRALVSGFRRSFEGQEPLAVNDVQALLAKERLGAGCTAHYAGMLSKGTKSPEDIRAILESLAEAKEIPLNIVVPALCVCESQGSERSLIFLLLSLNEHLSRSTDFELSEAAALTIKALRGRTKKHEALLKYAEAAQLLKHDAFLRWNSAAVDKGLVDDVLRLIRQGNGSEFHYPYRLPLGDQVIIELPTGDSAENAGPKEGTHKGLLDVIRHSPIGLFDFDCRRLLREQSRNTRSWLGAREQEHREKGRDAEAGDLALAAATMFRNLAMSNNDDSELIVMTCVLALGSRGAKGRLSQADLKPVRAALDALAVSPPRQDFLLGKVNVHELQEAVRTELRRAFGDK